MPAVKSAKLTSAKSRPCNATIAAQIQGRTLRNKLHEYRAMEGVTVPDFRGAGHGAAA